MGPPIQMTEEHEAELRIALAEGILSREEAERLREELRDRAMSPFEHLKARGRLSDETLASLRKERRPALDETPGVIGGGANPPVDPDETASVHGPPPTARAPGAPAFPVAGWDRYPPVRFLGQGGMGRVFLARDPRLRREVALKFVREDDPELTRRFISEARAQARVNHPCVCKVFEVGEIDGKAFIAMQYVDGKPLGHLAPELTVEQKAILLRDAAEGVHEAHRAGLIHRDLKPSNLMVERTEDGRLRTYVMDFGLARDWKEGITVEGAVLGTPHYMSPEQARGEVAQLDRRADVYSLGATLYHLLLGHPPIPGSNGLEVLNKIATEEPRPPRALNPDVPADLEAIVLKCLEKDRSARYDSARALAEDLERFLSGEPVRARAGAWYRLRKRLRKHRLAVSAAAVAGTLVLLVGGWGVQLRREAALRERLAGRFTELVERIESRARYSDLSPLHDIRGDQKALRAQMDELEAEIREGGDRALGPGHYALGRGYLALGDETKAREYLESAWRHGFHEPRVAYALAVVTGHVYQRRLLEAERLPSPARREARRRELERLYRDPVLAYLRMSQGAEVPSNDYVAALLAFYEGQLDDALARAEQIGAKLPWFYEAPELRGDILVARASRRWTQGDRDGALADFEAGRKAYAAAAAIGESVPAIYRSMGELEQAMLAMELYGQGDVMPPYRRGLEAVSRASAIDPERGDVRLLEAGLHRRLAEQRITQGDDATEILQKAISAAQRALSLAPRGSEARLELGRSLSLLGRDRQAHHEDPREQLGKAVEVFGSLRPEDQSYEFNMELGLAFKVWADYEDQVGVSSLENRGKAIASYQAAIKLDERLPDAWINLGSAYFSRATHPKDPDPDGDLARARDALEKARALNPKHVVPYFYLGQVHQLLARRHREHGEDARPDLARAVEWYRHGLEINPKLPPLHNGLGLNLLELATESWDRGGDPEPLFAQARAAFEQANAVAPRHGLAYINLGELFARRARFQRARAEDPGPSVRAAAEALQHAIQLLPSHPLPWSNLGMVQAIQAGAELEHGRDPRASVARALEALHGALERNPNEAQAWLYLGEVRAVSARLRGKAAQDGDFEQAAQAFEKALELAPQEQDYPIAFGHFCLAWAAWRKETGRAPGSLVDRAFSLASELLARRPDWPDARVLRASALLARAEEAPPPGARQEWRRQAVEDFTRALAANRNLEPGWRSRLALAQRLLAGAP